MNTIQNEEWLDVPGYEARYQVSDQGRVRNASGHVLARNKQNSGYYIVHLYSGGKDTRKPHLVHRLVLAAFSGDDSADVNHIDGDKGNNARGNLERATRSENMLHASRLGLLTTSRKAVVGTRLTDGAIVRFKSQIAVERHFRGKQTGVVSRCLAGKCGSAYGYAWSRV